MEEKGRNCSIDYILKKDWLEKVKKIDKEVVYIVGGLYGNRFALDIINNFSKKENAQIIFNGDMHWFDVQKDDFLKIENLSKNSIKLLGNVEYELISKNNFLGCGCNYPKNVDSGVVERSNIIHNMMKNNLTEDSVLKEIKKRSKTMVIDLFGKKVAITHGDEKSMSGWECSHDNLKNKTRQNELDSWFVKNNVDILATTHTCLPALYNNGKNIVVNNGAAGMANLKGTTYGLITRIAKSQHKEAIISEKIADIYVELVKIDFSIDDFLEWFEICWDENSPASISYKNRILNGTTLERDEIKVSI
ncbi:hypothetical protein [Gemella cuniculi]|uniref:hypothetical protein n=1 Tax=Gemella cuniculi TaxID=150240 RepID=UPI0004084415|nr:hypothetical protein [Gemella cuniculi]